MKKILNVITLVCILLFISVSLARAQGNGCAVIDFPELIVTPGPFFPGPVTVTGQVNYNVHGGASKSIEVIINGQSNWHIVSGIGSIFINLVVPLGEGATITVNTYSSPKAGNGKLCDTVMQVALIPV